MPGQPRGETLSGDRNPPPRTQSPRKRNTKRGLRSTEAIEKRREKRTEKRRKARRKSRKHSEGREVQHEEKNNGIKPKAKAQEPKQRKGMKLRLGVERKISTINIRGVKKPGIRDEVEKWMKKNGIMIAGIQETRSNINSRETRKEYTWFFSGEGGREKYTAGVGLVIGNKFLQFIEDIEPIDDRLMYITLKCAIEITIVITYMPAADRPTEEKQRAYGNLQKVIDKRKGKGPLYIMGDWNARLIYPITIEEEEVMGKHTLHENGEKVENHTEGMRENRDLMIECCMTNELKIMNTMYRKRPEKN